MSYSHCRISVVVSTLTTVNMSYSHCLIDEMIYSWVRNLMRVTAVIMRYCEQPATRVGIRLFYYDRTLCTGQSFIEIKKKFWLSTFYQLGSRAAGVTAHQPAEHLDKYLTQPFPFFVCSDVPAASPLVRGRAARAHHVPRGQLHRQQLPAVPQDGLPHGQDRPAQGLHLLSLGLLQVHRVQLQAHTQDLLQQSGGCS